MSNMTYVTEFVEKNSVLIFDENMQTLDTKICSLFIFLGLYIVSQYRCLS